MVAGKKNVLNRWREYFDQLLNPNPAQNRDQPNEPMTEEEDDGPPLNGASKKSNRETEKQQGALNRQYPRRVHQIRGRNPTGKIAHASQRNLEGGKNTRRVADECYPPDPQERRQNDMRELYRNSTPKLRVQGSH